MTSSTRRARRVAAGMVLLIAVSCSMLLNGDMWHPVTEAARTATVQSGGEAMTALGKIDVKGRAANTGYDREMFGGGWAEIDGCSIRDVILHRDLVNPAVGDGCNVTSGTLNDPYTGKTISFTRGFATSADVQVDHVVALSDAWQKGAQQLSFERRHELANDPLELLAVDGSANQQKGGSDAASWLPPNKAFRCQYVARQIAVKLKYGLWVTLAEHDAIRGVLSRCPGQPLPAA